MLIPRMQRLFISWSVYRCHLCEYCANAPAAQYNDIARQKIRRLAIPDEYHDFTIIRKDFPNLEEVYLVYNDNRKTSNMTRKRDCRIHFSLCKATAISGYLLTTNENVDFITWDDFLNLRFGWEWEDVAAQKTQKVFYCLKLNVYENKKNRMVMKICWKTLCTSTEAGTDRS